MQGGDYYRRLLEAYLLRKPSHLDFWHECPEINERAAYDRLGEYYLVYREKADYRGPFDPEGVPLLNYRGEIGLRHNPIAIAQYGLAQFNRHRQTGDEKARPAFLAAAGWLLRNLEKNRQGVPVWLHHFPWPYREGLRPPWASALAQGQGISVLVRAAAETGDSRYDEAARQAERAFRLPVSEGGVIFRDPEGGLWLEEYLVDPPSHILNGAISAAWGLFDAWLAFKDSEMKKFFDEAAGVLGKQLHRYDAGFWSLYELPSGAAPAMLASPFYHRLHIAQLKALGRMTADPVFERTAERWQAYEDNFGCRARALFGKALFKLRYY